MFKITGVEAYELLVLNLVVFFWLIPTAQNYWGEALGTLADLLPGGISQSDRGGSPSEHAKRASHLIRIYRDTFDIHLPLFIIPTVAIPCSGLLTFFIVGLPSPDILEPNGILWLTYTALHLTVLGTFTSIFAHVYLLAKFRPSKTMLHLKEEAQALPQRVVILAPQDESVS